MVRKWASHSGGYSKIIQNRETGILKLKIYSDDRRNLKKSRADCDWKHDRFDEKFQRPKTKKQIVTKYGFDIRHKDGTPIQDGEEIDAPAPESTEEESSDARQVSRQQKDRRVSSTTRGKVGKSGTSRRPMKQREREDTVDESKGEEEEDQGVRPAQKRQVKQQEKPRKQSEFSGFLNMLGLS